MSWFRTLWSGLFRSDKEAKAGRFPKVPGFEVLWRLGGGGHAEVFVARKKGSRRKVALKVIREHAQENPWLRGHFYDEFLILQTFDHPNIARAYEWGKLADGRGFFTMERYTGGTLKDWLWRQRSPEEPLPPGLCAGIAQTLARAVDYAHNRGVIHRDLKPVNVTIAAGGRLKVIDWSSAKIVDNWGLTPELMWVGTPGRTPPREPIHLATPALDVFLLGAMLYEMLTGQVPSQGETLPDLSEPTFRPKWSLRQLRDDVPDELDKIVLKCLQRDADDRFRTAAELARALEKFVHHQKMKQTRLINPGCC